MGDAKIAVLPGDGIGPEVIAEAVAVLEEVARCRGHRFQFVYADIGGASIDRWGVPLTDETMERLASCDSVFLGAVGGPAWEQLDISVRPERALLRLRKELGLFANLRPARLHEPLIGASTLRPAVVRGVDLVVVREFTGGIYFGEPRGVFDENGSRVGVNTLRYSEEEIARVTHAAFDLARRRRKKLVSVDKANVLEVSELWRRVVGEVARGYADVQLENLYVDNAAMQLVRDPRQFDVMLTSNMFGDILSDEAAMLTGSIGMLASASLGGGRFGLYEPVHGSAPDIAGKGMANPLAAILSAALLLRHSLGLTGEADAVEEAVESALARGLRTPDISAPVDRVVGTAEMGLAVREVLRR